MAYKVSLNTVLNWQKKENRRDEVRKEIVAGSIIEISENNIRDELYLLIKALSEIDRMIMTLDLDGYQNIEIAEITGMKVNNINVKLYRLKNQIIEQLKIRKDGSL
ncbi:MAG: DNA-directed RNA polymerase specialized sigma24 family protein [Saprospiraceae bacterium]|jgi:DNA-directed RNA polymerase specialized sigma24 family protein